VQTVLARRSAEIVPFVNKAYTANRFTAMDRIHALDWDMTNAAPAGARLAIHARRDDDAPEVGEYLSIYRANERWAAWGAARQGPVITVWHGPSGSDLGHFPSMKDALAAVSDASILRRTQP
jgi:hypothetical protein